MSSSEVLIKATDEGASIKDGGQQHHQQSNVAGKGKFRWIINYYFFVLK